MHPGNITKRCSCKDATGRRLGAACPQLRRTGGAWSPTHGSYHIQIELPTALGKPRRPLRRGGYDTRTAAEAGIEHVRSLLALADGDSAIAVEIADMLLAVKYGKPFPDRDTVARRVGAGLSATYKITVGVYLDEWLGEHDSIEPTTRRCYESHIRVHLRPHLGELQLEKLRTKHVRTMFDAIKANNARIEAARASSDPTVRNAVKGHRTTSATTMQRIRATLRKALNDAITSDERPLLAFNPATHVKLSSGKRPKPRAWDSSAIKHWKATGQRPSPVMVWQPDDAGAFLDYAENHDIVLYPLFELILSRGLRRGEACGIRDMDINLDDATLTIVQQLTTCGYEPLIKDVKSDAGERVLNLDPYTIAILRTYLGRRARWKLAAGNQWPATGLFFVQPDGAQWHPDTVSNRFEILIRDSGLPPIRLHDLRHCAASYMRLAGADMKKVQEDLGHSSSVITSDTYTTLFRHLEKNVSDRTGDILHRNRRNKAA